ncbi:MAG: SDR family oxidoreductase [Deltaproteobacteria bacterium]|nr:SDR family oxidoreductase [Deltaproteobacteria bacterium]
MTALAGKIVLITGAARRLGRAIALSLAAEGADIALHVHTSSGEDLAREIAALGRRAWVMRANLARPEEAARFSETVLAAVGRIDILVNNAAVVFPTPLPTLTASLWRTVLHTNLTAPFVLSLRLGRIMQRRGMGKILQLGDWSGVRPVAGYLPYCVSKNGLLMLTQVLAKTFAPQVQVNAVAPGPVLPPDSYTTVERQAVLARTPLRRLGQAADVVRAVRFLVTMGNFVSGSTYFVDGGCLVSEPEGTSTSL